MKNQSICCLLQASDSQVNFINYNVTHLIMNVDMDILLFQRPPAAVIDIPGRYECWKSIYQSNGLRTMSMTRAIIKSRLL